MGSFFTSFLHNLTAAVAASVAPIAVAVSQGAGPSDVFTGGALTAMQHNPTLALGYAILFMVARDQLKNVPAFAAASGTTK